MVKSLRLSSKNAFCLNITVGPSGYLVNGASQESGATGKTTVEGENSSNVAYPSEGNHVEESTGVGFKDFDATGKLVVDTGTGIICRGMVFTIAGVTGGDGAYLVTSVSNATLKKVFAAPSVTTIYFKGISGGNLDASPSNNAALTFDTTFRLPPYRMEKDITIVNNDASNALSVFVANTPGETLHADTRPANTIGVFPHGSLASQAAMTLEISDASDIYLKGASGETVTIFGS